MNQIKVGFIGCGRISDLHFPGYLERSDARVAAVCDTNRELGEQRKKEWKADAYYQDYREMLEDSSIDAVEILSPQKLHEAMVIDAIKAGKHVNLQKPMTIDLESADRMLDAARQSSVVFRVSDNYVFYPPVVLAKKLIDEGEIGTPVNLRIKMIAGGSGGWEVPASAWSWRAAENSEGRGFQTFDHGHNLWAVAWFLMGSVERVCAWIDTMDGIVDSPAVMMWKYRDGAKYGSCEYNYSPQLPIPSKYYANDEWFEITGTSGMILINRCTGNLLDGPGLSLFNQAGWKYYEKVKTDWKEGFIGSTHNFVDSIKGDVSPMLTGDQAREILKLNLAISKSSQVRREVYVDELDAPTPWAFTKKQIREEIEASRKKKRSPSQMPFSQGTEPIREQDIDDLMRQLQNRFLSEKAAGWQSVIRLELKKDDSSSIVYFLSFSKGKFDLKKTIEAAAFDLTIRIPLIAWKDIMNGRSSIEIAFSQGDLELDGKIEDGIKLREVFDL